MFGKMYGRIKEEFKRKYKTFMFYARYAINPEPTDRQFQELNQLLDEYLIELRDMKREFDLIKNSKNTENKNSLENQL